MKQQTKIPEDWEEVEFEDLCEKIQSGGTPLTSKKEYYNGEIPFVKIDDITLAGKYLEKTNISISKEGLENSSAWLVPENSLLLAIYGSFGKITINKIKLATNQAILGIILKKEKADLDFIYYLINHTNLKKYAKQSTQANLTAEIIRELKLLIPTSLLEQRAISLILSTCDEVIQKVEREIEITERLKKGAMRKLLNESNSKLVKVSDLGKYINGFGFGPADWSKEGLPIIRIQNLTDLNEVFNFFNGPVDSRYIVNDGDLLFPWSGSIGVYLWNRGKALLNQHIFRVIPEKGVDKMYLYYILNLAIAKLSGRIHGSTMKHFKRGELEKVSVPLPTLSEQQKIASILSTIDAKLSLQKSRKEKLERIKKGLMNELLTGRKRVNVEKVLSLGGEK